jgi:hypothetical protein
MCGAFMVDIIWTEMETKLSEVATRFETLPGIIDAMREGIVCLISGMAFGTPRLKPKGRDPAQG